MCNMYINMSTLTCPGRRCDFSTRLGLTRSGGLNSPSHTKRRVSCSVLQCVAVLQCNAVCCSVLQCGAVWCSVLQCVAVCCSVLQCVAVCCSVL